MCIRDRAIPWAAAYIGEIRIADGGGSDSKDNEIDTVSGNLELDSAGGTVLVDDNLNVLGVATFTNATFNAGGTIHANGDISVDGETELDNLNVTGVTTFTDTVNMTNASLKMTSTNAYFAPPSLTTTERNNATNLVAGAMIWNETTARFEYWNGSDWRKISNSAV